MKTAVEWLYEEFTKTNHLTEDEFYMKFEQAKEMEKEHIIDAYERGWDMGVLPNDCNSEQYYNETFKSE